MVMGGRYYSISPDEYIFASLNIYLVSECDVCWQHGLQLADTNAHPRTENGSLCTWWFIVADAAALCVSFCAAGHHQPVHLDAVPHRSGKQQQLSWCLYDLNQRTELGVPF